MDKLWQIGQLGQLKIFGGDRVGKSRGVTAQLHQMNVADFETCDSRVAKEGEIVPQRVWLAGVKNLQTMKTKLFTSLDDFMTNILSRQENTNREYAFHNLKFDGSFIIPWLFNNGFVATKTIPKKGEFSVLIDDRNNWYSIRIQVTTKRKVTIWDNVKLFPIQLEYLHSVYGTPTKKIHEDDSFYGRVRPKGHTPTHEEISYIENDLQVMAETLNEHINLYGLRFKKTQASQAFANFEEYFPYWRLRFPALEEADDKEIRPAYWGGISYVNDRYVGRDMYDIIVYDINSSYPYQLANKKMPYGHMVSKTYGQKPIMSNFWVAECLVKFKIKEGCIPCIPKKKVVEGRPEINDEWLKDSRGIIRLRFCAIDYLTIMESYEFEVLEWVWVMHWAWKVQKEVANYIYINNDNKIKYRELADKTKDNAKKREYKAAEHRAKINNNAFYGKFGESIEKIGKTPHPEHENGVVYKTDRFDITKMYNRKFLPVAIATTAWGRRQLVQFANGIGKDFIYCDTDSIHMRKKGFDKVNKLKREGLIELNHSELGAWDFEGEFYRGRFLRAKCYFEQKKGETPDVTLAGLPADKHSGPRSKKRSCITWDNFHIGLELPASVTNKLGSRRTPTGNKLVPMPFKITETSSPFLQ